MLILSSMDDCGYNNMRTCEQVSSASIVEMSTAYDIEARDSSSIQYHVENEDFLHGLVPILAWSFVSQRRKTPQTRLGCEHRSS